MKNIEKIQVNFILNLIFYKYENKRPWLEVIEEEKSKIKGHNATDKSMQNDQTKTFNDNYITKNKIGGKKFCLRLNG